MSLASVAAFEVPTEIVERTESSLRKAGTEGFELFVLWSGVPRSDLFHIQQAHVPKQSSYKTEEGLMVRVEADALHSLNVWLYENGQQLGAQVHAHPTEAFHSDTDDTYPIISTTGSLSIVAADFCAHGLLHPSSAAYQLVPHGWSQVELPDVLQVAS